MSTPISLTKWHNEITKLLPDAIVETDDPEETRVALPWRGRTVWEITRDSAGFWLTEFLFTSAYIELVRDDVVGFSETLPGIAEQARSRVAEHDRLTTVQAELDRITSRRN